MENAPAQNLELLRGPTMLEGTDEMEAAQAAERAVEVAETQPEVVEEQSILARAGARVGEFVRDHTPRKLTAGLAVAAIAVGGAVKTSNHSAEKAEAAPTASKTLGPNALKKLCVQAGLKMPVVADATLGRLAEKSQGYQGWGLAEKNWVVPSECNGKYKRFMWVRPEVQNPRHPKRWRPVLRPKWSFATADNRGVLGDKNDSNYVGEYGGNSAYQEFHVDMDGPASLIYGCAPGPRKNRARFKVWNRVKDITTGKFVKGRVKKYPVKVVPPC